MFGLLKSDPQKKLQAEYQKLLEKAMQYQRNGDIRTYSEITAEAEKVREQLEQLKTAK